MVLWYNICIYSSYLVLYAAEEQRGRKSSTTTYQSLRGDTGHDYLLSPLLYTVAVLRRSIMLCIRCFVLKEGGALCTRI